MQTTSKISGLFVGKPQQRRAGKPPSAIAKQQVSGPLELLEDGFTIDEQADKKVHGGAEKAVHHYPAEHYAFWRDQGFDTPFEFTPGAFGENISTRGWTEELVCIGDILELGTALVQINQGRQPCWKLNMHTSFKMMALELQNSGRTGWYYRVLRPGVVEMGDDIRLVERLHANWPLADVIAARFDKNLSTETAAELAAIEAMAAGWRKYFTKKAGGAFVEDQTSRLVGPMGENPPQNERA
ncbi:MOSC domain-containing protein [Maritalea myrionectae]|uniref:MOSC domain-containing protein n=1 Tax=Maritalea myrionectae TaxID=454601 RepID=UPI000423CA3E|nr:MOSC domain-containing protein [Maritalea myrionectae]